MATFATTLTGSAFCSPNDGHVTLTMTGKVSGARRIEADDLRGVPTDLDYAAALLVVARYHGGNMTRAQIKSALVGGGIEIKTVVTLL